MSIISSSFRNYDLIIIDRIIRSFLPVSTLLFRYRFFIPIWNERHILYDVTYSIYNVVFMQSIC